MPKITQDIPTLRKISSPVESVQEAEEIIEKLKNTLSKVSSGIGLGAIQIGIDKRIAVIKSSRSEGGYHYLINPTFVEGDSEFIYVGEGCLSFPGMFLDTKRFKEYIIDNHVIDGDELRPQREEFFYSSDPEEDRWSDGLLSIAIQHEVDHLNGKLFMDFDMPKSVPKVVTGKKIGRNDPCPCGSGKKYKKCCL